MKEFVALAGCLLALVITGCGKRSTDESAPPANTAAESAATESAQAWLKLVDEGNYGQSWSLAAAAFKSAVTEADWDKTVRAARTPLGKVLSRTLSSRQYTTSLPGAPDGKYVVVVYETTFEHKTGANETVTPMLEADGKWRVSGYYIK